jgi:hypothetical protein
MDQGTGIRVFQHPERTIGALLDITDALSYIPTLGCFGAAMAIKDAVGDIRTLGLRFLDGEYVSPATFFDTYSLPATAMS